MEEYGAQTKARMLSKLVGPNAVSAAQLSRETGISQATLSRWLSAARAGKVNAMMSRPPVNGRKDSRPTANRDEAGTPQGARPSTGAERLAVVAEAKGLEGAALGELLRRHGVTLEELERWRRAASESLESGHRSAPSKQVRRLEAELSRKDKALAEVTALLVLKKKVAALLGDEDDEPTSRSDE
jgi:transposase-like protein